jgi:hypothetical protein
MRTEDNRSDGETKFPAALLMTISGSPSFASTKSSAASTSLGFRTSQATATTREPVALLISAAVAAMTSAFLLEMHTDAPSACTTRAHT